MEEGGGKALPAPVCGATVGAAVASFAERACRVGGMSVGSFLCGSSQESEWSARQISLFLSISYLILKNIHMCSEVFGVPGR